MNYNISSWKHPETNKEQTNGTTWHIKTQQLNKFPAYRETPRYVTFTPSQGCPIRGPPSFGMRPMAVFINNVYSEIRVVDPRPLPKQGLHIVRYIAFYNNFQ